MITLPNIHVCGQIEFSRVRFSGVSFSKILSIWDRNTNYETYMKQQFPESEITFTYFDDDLTDPTAEDIRGCLEWGKTLNPSETVLVHCQAGLSRSPAIALGILKMYLKDEAAAYHELRRIRPQAHPNTHILNLIERELG